VNIFPLGQPTTRFIVNGVGTANRGIRDAFFRFGVHVCEFGDLPSVLLANHCLISLPKSFITMIRPTNILVSLCLLLPGLVSFSNASRSFTYNDDIACTYPFEVFQIESIECGDSSSYFTYVYNDEDMEEADEGVCYFGQSMDIAGQVTVSGEQISRYFDVSLKVCFQHPWYYIQTRACMTYRTNLDLLAATGQVAEYGDEVNECEDYGDENNNNRYGYRGNTCNDMVEEGTHNFKMRLQIPKKDFKFHEGTIAVVFPDRFMMDILCEAYTFRFRHRIRCQGRPNTISQTEIPKRRAQLVLLLRARWVPREDGVPRDIYGWRGQRQRKVLVPLHGSFGTHLCRGNCCCRWFQPSPALLHLLGCRWHCFGRFVHRRDRRQRIRVGRFCKLGKGSSRLAPGRGNVQIVL